MIRRAIHQKEALQLLKEEGPHKLRLWKMSTGDILEYPQAYLLNYSPRRGIAKVRLQPSCVIHEFHLFCLHQIDDLDIYL